MDDRYISMDSITFPAKLLKPLRITVPEAVGEALELEPGALVEVTIKKIKDAPKPAMMEAGLPGPK